MIRISVVIPTKDRPEQLRRCLESFAKAEYPADAWELIVVDDGGTCSFDDIPDALLCALPIHQIQQTNTGPAGARNRGAWLAEGAILAFTDDDCVIEPDWLTRIEAAFEAGECACIGGAVLNMHPSNVAAVAWDTYLQALYQLYTDSHGNVVLITSNNVAYQRDVYMQLGGFNEAFSLAAAEDMELGQRLVANGYGQRLEPSIQLWHDHASTAGDYLRTQFRYGRGAVRLKRITAEQGYNQRIAWVARRKGAFFAGIAGQLWRARAPLGVWLLIVLTPVAHRLGQWAES